MAQAKGTPPRAPQPGEVGRAWRRLAAQTAARSVRVRACPARAEGAYEQGVTPSGVTTNVRLRRAIAWFADTPRGPEAFLTRFAAMPKRLRRALVRRFDPEDPWRAYREVCRLYGL